MNSYFKAFGENKDIKIVNNKMVIKLLFRNLFQLFVEVIVFSESA